jgi:hypothetical protein
MDEAVTTRDAAFQFLTACGLDPVPDAIDQLVEAFLPALTIICTRGYHPRGKTWKTGGWRGLLYEIFKKTDRLNWRAWINGEFDDDDPIDLINFLGFYYRLHHEGKPWGKWGKPRKDKR